ncbi:ADP-ribose glycohydrolase MACROD2 isoform X3 [Hypomesus transpacificus]|uniref:ADP-ribose glycohydrolase MACROD2 isoform X3 n=1 Tax=Hypomesus transpacificus TaxID=137520 RepID=UPI001F0869F4|nr:ADP-ribose glycohydrolase MACROD2 isoform X3 [Hypomesus transpacificus]
MNKKKKDWKEEKVKLLNMSLEERRRQYRSDHVTLEKILTWRQMSKAEVDGHSLLIDKVSLYKGDITILEVDAIVNAASDALEREWNPRHLIGTRVDPKGVLVRRPGLL